MKDKFLFLLTLLCIFFVLMFSLQRNYSLPQKYPSSAGCILMTSSPRQRIIFHLECKYYVLCLLVTKHHREDLATKVLFACPLPKTILVNTKTFHRYTFFPLITQLYIVVLVLGIFNKMMLGYKFSISSFSVSYHFIALLGCV